MAKRSIREVLSGSLALGSSVEVAGWLRTRRDSKAGLSFLNMSDGSCFATLQVIADRQLENYASDVLHLVAGSALVVIGKLIESPGHGQNVELSAERIEVIGVIDDPEAYPIQPKRHSLEFLREVAHLRPRTNTFGAMARVRDCVSQAIQGFFRQEGFVWVHTPIITASDCEGAGALFRVSTLDLANPPRRPDGGVDFGQDFFGRETFLTVSGQLELETYCLALSKVYTFGPTFRAENSNTSRHLAEFWMVEPELAFADLTDDAELAERFLKHIFRTLLDERADDMAFFRDRVDRQCIERLERFVVTSFERMQYAEVVEALQRHPPPEGFEFPVHWGADLQTEHERYLTEKLVGRPVVVMNYPKEIKAFYMRLDDDERTVAAMDVLAPGIGEIIGGAQREERLDVLDRRMAELGLSGATYSWYRDLRRYGTVPHAGFGLGLERTLVYATGMANVRDVIPFPRTPGNAEF
jgi:asparaginyl-tRNA synthetase